MNKERKMTRTTELLKEIEKLDKNGVSLTSFSRRLIKSELKGRLDALKELLSSKERHLKDLKECATNKIVGSWIWVNATIKRLTKELASIQEEIKLIEAGI